MTDLQITGLAGDKRTIARDTLETFAAGLEGSVLYPDDAGFAEATLLWNGMIEKRPAVVVRPATVQDVVQTVNFARDNERLSCRSRAAATTSPAWRCPTAASRSTCRGLRDIKVDPDARLARVGPGCNAGRRRSGDPGARSGDDARLRLGDGRRRSDARRRVRLPEPSVRVDGRRPRGSRDRHRRRRPSVAHRAPRTTTCSGRCVEAAATSAS